MRAAIDQHYARHCVGASAAGAMDVAAICTIIPAIYAAKIAADDADDAERGRRVPLSSFLVDFFVQGCGRRSTAHAQLFALLASLMRHSDVPPAPFVPRVDLFARLLGLHVACLCVRTPSGACACGPRASCRARSSRSSSAPCESSLAPTRRSRALGDDAVAGGVHPRGKAEAGEGQGVARAGRRGAR